jgi:hypothetical protein
MHNQDSRLIRRWAIKKNLKKILLFQKIVLMLPNSTILYCYTQMGTLLKIIKKYYRCNGYFFQDSHVFKFQLWGYVLKDG